MQPSIYITRKQKWFDTIHTNDITLEEWRSFVKNDPEMRLYDYTETILENGETFRYDNPGAAAYLFRHNGETANIFFEYESGNIKTSLPQNDQVMEKVKHIAFKLSAHVQNEDPVAEEEIPLEKEEEPKPAFEFSDLLNPIKKAIHNIQHKAGNNTPLNPLPETDNKPPHSNKGQE